MSGRLQMTGAGAVRGDRAVGLAMVSKASVQLTRNGKNVVHLEAAREGERKHLGAPVRRLVVGSGEKRPAARIILPTRSQWVSWGGGGLLAYSGKKAVDRRVTKRDADRRRRTGAIMAGTAAGVGAADLGTNVAGWVGREGIKYHEALVNSGHIAHPMSRKARSRRLDEHKAEHGVGSNVNNAPQAYYRKWPKELPGARARRIMGWKNHPPVVAGILAGGAAAGAAYGAHRSKVRKVDTTMSEREAHQLARRYDTRGPLPKGLTREQKMKAYEARYIASGGKQGEKWQRRADRAEVTRNVGLAGATVSAAGLLATRGRRTGPAVRRVGLTSHRAETGALASGLLGGAAELYGEHARNRRASYANTPAGVAGSALSRMRAYTPGGQK